jgi:ankyrin repeat protein
MVHAVSNDDERTVASLLKRGVDVDTVVADTDGATLLIVAAKTGKPAMMKTLLAAHPKVNARNGRGETALMLAAFGGHLEAVQLLLANGAEVNPPPGWTPLIYSAAANSMEVGRLLLKSGAQVNARSASGTTALMMAAREGHLSMVLLLMEHGADLGIRNEDGATALKVARDRGKREIAEMLTRAGAKE